MRAFHMLCLFFVLLGCGDAGVPLPSHDGGTQGEPRLLTCLVAHVLHDFPSLPNKQWSKVEVFFTQADEVRPEDIERVYVTGPSGDTLEIPNVPFMAPLVSGYVDNRELGGIWYQALLQGFLADGRYEVHVRWRDGRHDKRARTLRANTELLSFYEANKARMTYEPTGSAEADDAQLRWTTLAALGGPDAYYNAWVSAGTADAVDPNSARGDTIFARADSDPTAGLNLDHFRASDAEHPLQVGPHTWQPEILDANVLDEVDAIIFPPGQHFAAR